MPSPLNYSYFEKNDSEVLLVVIHGLFGTMDNLSVVRRHFVDSMNVLTIDLLDHGESKHIDNFSLDACVDALLPLIQQYKKSKVAIVGHSLGGKVAMRFALRYPDELDSLIVADIAPVTYKPRHDDIFKGLNSVDLGAVSKRSDADSAMTPLIPEAGVRQFLLKACIKTSRKTGSGDLTLLVWKQIIRKLLAGRLLMPYLISQHCLSKRVIQITSI